MSTEWTDDEVRDRFSDAIEGGLSEADKATFDAAIEKNAELREELEAFRTMMRGTAKLAAETETDVEEKAPEILGAVQERIHKRSKGRYFRDRFSREATRRSSTVLLAMLVILTIAAGVLALRLLVVIDDAPPPAPPAAADS